MKTIVFVFLMIPVMMSSQINQSDSLKLKANLSLTGVWQDGNVETIIFRAKSELLVKPWKKWVFKNKSSYVYQEFGNTKADEDILTLNFLYFNPDRKIHPFMLGFVSTNYRREIELRSLLGAGVSFQLYTKEKDWLKFSLSSEYEQTKFSKSDFNLPQYDGNKSINTLRTTLWVNGKYYFFKNKLIFTHESYFQPSLEASNNYRWQADLALEIPVWDFLNFKINYLHAFESIVIENQKRVDKFLTFGFTIKNHKS